MTPDVHATTVASGCHIFSGCGYPSPGLEDFQFRPIFTVGRAARHQADPAHGDRRGRRGRVLLGRFRQAQARAAGSPERRRARRAVRPGPDPAPDDRQEGRRLPALPGDAVLLHLGDEPDGDHPGRAVPGSRAHRIRLDPGRPGLAHLHVGGLQDSRAYRLLQAHDPRRAVVDPVAARAHRAVLRHPGQAVHARRPAVRQHVRRAPAAARLLPGHVVLRQRVYRRWYTRQARWRWCSCSPGSSC